MIVIPVSARVLNELACVLANDLALPIDQMGYQLTLSQSWNREVLALSVEGEPAATLATFERSRLLKGDRWVRKD